MQREMGDGMHIRAMALSVYHAVCISGPSTYILYRKVFGSKQLPFYVSLVMSNLHFDGPALSLAFSVICSLWSNVDRVATVSIRASQNYARYMSRFNTFNR